MTWNLMKTNKEAVIILTCDGSRWDRQSRSPIKTVIDMVNFNIGGIKDTAGEVRMLYDNFLFQRKDGGSPLIWLRYDFESGT